MRMQNWQGVFRTVGSGKPRLLAIFPTIGNARDYANDKYPSWAIGEFDPPHKITIGPVRVENPKYGD